MWIAELVPLSATLFSFIYGVSKFFKKGKPLFLQSITMAMGSHALGSIYHLCQTLTTETVLEGFSPAYLGRIGFFLFFIAASYGQMDRIVDDGSAIAAYNNSTVIMNGGSISNNRMYYPNSAYATRPCGTLHLNDSKAVLTDVEIANNDSAGLQWAEGLLIYLDDSEATIENCVIKNNGWLPTDKDPSTGKVITAEIPQSLFYLDDSTCSLTVTGCKFENNGEEKKDLTHLPGRHYDIFNIGDGKLVVTDSSFENNNLNHIIGAYYGTFKVENSRFINNRARLFYCAIDSGYFDKCTFSGNNIKGQNGVFVKYLKPSKGIQFSDCEFVNNPLTDEKYEKSEIINNATPNGAGSIFGEGSVTMIVALLALITSGVSIFLTVYYNKKKKTSVVAETEYEGEE